jgi:hypothetical protein
MNSLYENKNILGRAYDLVACDTCGGLTAWSRCVMCGGNYAEHNTLGKESK